MTEEEKEANEVIRKLVAEGAGAIRPDDMQLRMLREQDPQTYEAFWPRRRRRVAFLVIQKKTLRVEVPWWKGIVVHTSPTQGDDKLLDDERDPQLAAAKDAICDFYSRKAAGLA